MTSYKFNKIDLNKYRTEEVSSIFTKEGVFSDGRPYIFECWSGYSRTMVTIFIPAIGFEIFDEWKENTLIRGLPTDIQAYLEKESYEHDFFSKGVNIFCFGNEADKLLSINVLIGIDNEKSTTASNTKQCCDVSKGHSPRFLELMQRTEPIDRYFYFTVEEAVFLAQEDLDTFWSKFRDDAEFVAHYVLGWWGDRSTD